VRTLANAMDVGNPSNFERMLWLYGGKVEAMRHDVGGSRHTDDEVQSTIRRVYEQRGYLLDPHSAIAYLGLCRAWGSSPGGGPPPGAEVGIFLATAHPAKFREIVEPIVGHPLETPAPLASALARPRHILRIEPSFDAVASLLCG
jgi:threonine synthase